MYNYCFHRSVKQFLKEQSNLPSFLKVIFSNEINLNDFDNEDIEKFKVTGNQETINNANKEDIVNDSTLVLLIYLFFIFKTINIIFLLLKHNNTIISLFEIKLNRLVYLFIVNLSCTTFIKIVYYYSKKKKYSFLDETYRVILTFLLIRDQYYYY